LHQTEACQNKKNKKDFTVIFQISHKKSE